MSEAPTEPITPEAQAAERQPESWWATLRFVLILFALALFLRTFVVAPFSIPSGSMLPRLMIGDYLFVSKWSYGYSRYSMPFGVFDFGGRILGGVPERGDVVVFRDPGGPDDIVKRVIGLPGDTIEIREGALILNGDALPRRRIADYAMAISPNSPCRGAGGAVRRLTDEQGRPICAYPRFRETLPGGRSYDVLDQITDGDGDLFGPVQVPQGHLFVMGDNRDDSLDSRFPVEGRDGIGFLPVDNLLGKVVVTFWSTDGSAEWLKPWTWLSANRWSRLG